MAASVVHRIAGGRESCRAEQGQGSAGEVDGGRDHDSCNPVQIALAEHAITRP